MKNLPSHTVLINALLIFLLSLTSCSPHKNLAASPNLKTAELFQVIGGKFVLENSSIAASTVGIYDQKNDFTCTATLITNSVAITAAHCIESAPENIQIIFGLELAATIESQDSDIRRRQIKTATAVLVHPQWTGDYNRTSDWNDLALVQFAEGLPEGYKPATWLSDKSELFTGAKVTVAGFGATQVKIHHINEKKFPHLEKAIANGEIVCDETFENEKKRCYRIEFLGDDDLKMTTVPIESITQSEVRLDESHGHGTCVGDSGGPAFIEKNGIYYYFGITSRGSDACDGYGIYTNALYFKTWVDESIRFLFAPVSRDN